MSAHLNEVVHEESNVVSATEVLFQKLQAAAQSGKSENIGTIIELAKQINDTRRKENEGKIYDARYALFVARQKTKEAHAAEELVFMELKELVGGDMKKVKFSEEENQKFAARYAAETK